MAAAGDAWADTAGGTSGAIWGLLLRAWGGELGDTGTADAARVAAHFRAIGLPDGLATAGIEASGARLVEHMRHDKKMAAGTLPFLLARGIGQTYLDQTVDLADVETFLDAQPR